MNKMLPLPHERKRVSWREILLALIALACAAGWLQERVENRNANEVREFIGGLRQLRREPDSVVQVVIYGGDFPVACRMTKFDTRPPAELPESETEADDESAESSAAPASKPDATGTQPKTAGKAETSGGAAGPDSKKSNEAPR
jgi:hypothetical protein